MIKIFLIYFLLAVYFYRLIPNPAIAWASLVGPSIAFFLWAFFRFIRDNRLQLDSSFLKQGFPFGWQKAFLLFALISPVAAFAHGAPMDAMASSMVALLLIFLISFQENRPIDIRFVQILFLGCCVGSVVSYHMGFNDFGYLPWQELGCTFEGIFRVSLFPTLSDSALFSLLVLIVSVYYRTRLSLLVIPLAGYFVYFSYSRTAILVIGILFMVEVLARLRVGPNIIFFMISFMIVASVIFAPNAGALLVKAENTFTSFFKSKDVEEVANGNVTTNGEIQTVDNEQESYVEHRLTRQECGKPSSKIKVPVSGEDSVDDALSASISLTGRAELWRDHIIGFLSSPISGLGREGAISHLKQESSFSSRTGSESFLTRILAEFGVVALLFWIGMWRLFVFSCKSGSSAARGLVAAMIVIFAIYGSSVTPYGFLLLIHICLIGYAIYVKSKPYDVESN